MKLLTKVLLISSLSVTYVQINGFDFRDVLKNQVKGYHFHSYFFQENPKSRAEADRLRTNVLKEINRNYLYGCIVSDIYGEPHGPHPLGNFITCCNDTSMWRALPWFMQNHGNLSVLMHALTPDYYSDHTDRAMFLGQVVPLDLTRYNLPHSGGYLLKCIPEDWP